MGAPKNTIVVSRTYRADSDSCTRALKLLLKDKEGSPTLTTLDDTKVRSSSDDFRAKDRVP